MVDNLEKLPWPTTLMEKLFRGEIKSVVLKKGEYTLPTKEKIFLVIHVSKLLGMKFYAFANADMAIEFANIMVCDQGKFGEIEEFIVKTPCLYSAMYNVEGDNVRVEECELK